MKLFLSLVVIYTVIIAVHSANSKLCDVCQCKVKSNVSTIIDCSNEENYSFLEDIYKAEMYGINNTLFDIHCFNMTNMPLLMLHQPIPKSQIQILDLTNTELLNVTNEAFKNIVGLKEIRLGRNQIELLTPETFKGSQVDNQDYPLKNLTILYLNHNKLHSIHGDAFQHIEQYLQELYLQGNPFKLLDISTQQAIHGLLKLRILDLSDTQLATLPPDFLHTPGKLEEFYLGHNLFTNVTDLGLHRAHVLKKLVLSGNPFVNITEQTAFPEVSTIEVLYLCEMQMLQVIGNHSLRGLTGLKELHIAHNPLLRTIGESAITMVVEGVPVVERIEKLYLNNNALTRLDLLVDWSQLKEFNINDNPWTCECENQWMVDTLMPKYCAINDKLCKALRCAAPVEMEQFTFKDLHDRKYQMRCLDAYGHHPENDGIILVCFMLGVLIGIVVILVGIYAWKQHWFGVFDKSPAAYSRQFYGRTTTHDDYVE